MLASQAALCGLTGRLATGVFQTLSAGNIGQLGAPGTGVPADAAEGATPSVRPSPSSATTRNATGTAVVCRPIGAPLPARPYPSAAAHARDPDALVADPLGSLRATAAGRVQ